MHRVVKYVIRYLFNAFKAYHKFPCAIASESRTKTLSERSALPVHKRQVIDRNVNSHGVSCSFNGNEPEITDSKKYELCRMIVAVRTLFHFHSTLMIDTIASSI